jgi:Uma2 family endonuclease
VKEYWLIDPDRETLEQYELDPQTRELRHVATYQRDETLRSKLLPGFALRLAELWE